MGLLKKIITSIKREESVSAPVPVPPPAPRKKETGKTDKKKTKKPKKGKKKRSEKQIACNDEFKAQRELYTTFHAAVMEVCPAWELLAAWLKRVTRSGDNCFQAINHKYMDGDKVACPALFHFSLGELAIPWDMQATREGDIVLFTWHDTRDYPHARGSDRLVIGILYDDYRDRPVIVETRSPRSHGAASIILDPKYGQRVHVYPFFERANKTAYSDDQYFLIEN